MALLLRLVSFGDDRSASILRIWKRRRRRRRRLRSPLCYNDKYWENSSRELKQTRALERGRRARGKRRREKRRETDPLTQHKNAKLLFASPARSFRVGGRKELTENRGNMCSDVDLNRHGEQEENQATRDARCLKLSKNSFTRAFLSPSAVRSEQERFVSHLAFAHRILSAREHRAHLEPGSMASANR